MKQAIVRFLRLNSRMVLADGAAVPIAGDPFVGKASAGISGASEVFARPCGGAQCLISARFVNLAVNVGYPRLTDELTVSESAGAA